MKKNTVIVIVVAVVVVVVAVVAVVVQEATRDGGEGPVLVLKPKGGKTVETAMAVQEHEWFKIKMGSDELIKLGRGSSFKDGAKCLVGNDIIGLPLKFEAEYLSAESLETKIATGGEVVIRGDCDGSGKCAELHIAKVADDKSFEVEYTDRDGNKCTVEPKSKFWSRKKMPREFFDTAEKGQAYVLVDGKEEPLTQLTMQVKKD